MTVELNHTIVHARDKHASAAFLARILGISTSPEFGRFVPVVLTNGVSMDYMDSPDVHPQHYAFLVSDDTFDSAFERITSEGIAYHADPGGGGPGQLNHRWGGRGFYFPDPDGHSLELLTRVPPGA